ncbi:12931_t:CDS:2 [Ambispora leptoticha]|uniref:12931_t:CDS:1 n=1 Tax=Ambispora leptoticha TaxID=144679 RepID=A0A9N8VPU3_9GLOM|nr:12931_t:CDS:2 [Ambispora leptoticha]
MDESTLFFQHSSTSQKIHTHSQSFLAAASDLTYVLKWLEALQIRLSNKTQTDNNLFVTLSVSENDWEISVRCNKAYQINSKLPKEVFVKYEFNNSKGKESIKRSLFLNHFYQALKLHESVAFERCIISYDNAKEEINITSNAQCDDGSIESIESFVKLLMDYENEDCEPIQMDESNERRDWCCISMIANQLVVPLRTLWNMDQKDTNCDCPVSKDVRYHKKVLSPSFPALKASTTITILVDARNTLKLEMSIPIILDDSSSRNVIAEFLCLPNIEPDDEDDDDI